MANDGVVKAGLVLKRGERGQVGMDRIGLLEAIGREGSINGAAKAQGLSYKGAWDAVQALNNLFDRPLVASRVGGAQGGAASVTAEGESVIAAFHLVQAELERAMAVLRSRLQSPGGAPMSALLWSLAMKTSARNALGGTVVRFTDGAVNAEVVLDIGDGHEIVAIVTRDSVEALGLAPGRAAVALIKASFVTLAPGAEPPRTSARNALKGEIVRIEEGAVNSEVTLALGGGKTVTAVVTRQSVKALDLAIGQPCAALIKASHVILVVE
jgi:molybdate transport system regulatory protein